MSPNDSRDLSILSVSALNQAVAHTLERHFPTVWIAGEISNFKFYSSGHWYFTLKDETAQVRSVMFKSRTTQVGFLPRDGDKVEVRASVTLYTTRGDYQLNIEVIRRAGVGNLYEAFLRLKHKLQAEGCFDTSRKRALPQFVQSIGIVTSPQAAALRDVLSTLARRAPHLHIIIYPTPVQGEQAAEKIAKAIHTASLRAECALLLLCRGGGGIEDLWSFNEEIVARAIMATPMPVISGIGHETDFTIADFVADLRAATPTAAAELATIARNDWLTLLTSHANNLARAGQRQLSEAHQTIDWMRQRLGKPGKIISNEKLKLTNFQIRLQQAIRIPLTQSRTALHYLYTRWHTKRDQTTASYTKIAALKRRLNHAYIVQHRRKCESFLALQVQLDLLNPKRTLQRGYAIVSNAQGQLIRSPEVLHPGHIITLELAKGKTKIGIDSVQTMLKIDIP